MSVCFVPPRPRFCLRLCLRFVPGAVGVRVKHVDEREGKKRRFALNRERERANEKDKKKERKSEGGGERDLSWPSIPG